MKIYFDHEKLDVYRESILREDEPGYLSRRDREQEHEHDQEHE